MGFSRFDPGCCCGGETPCIRVQDDFARADSSTVGAGAVGPSPSETAGDWDILSNELHIDSSNAQISWNDTGTGTSLTCESGYARVKMKGADSGDVLRMDVSGSATTRIELTVGASATLKVIQTSTKKTVNVTAAADEWHTIEVRACKLSALTTGIYVYLNGSLQIYGVLNLQNVITSFVRLGTGTITADAFFDDLYMERNSSPNHTGSACDHGGQTCPDCPEMCGVPSSEAAAELDAVGTGFLDDAGGDLCGSCDEDLNQRFTLAKVDSFSVDVSALPSTEAEDSCLKYELTGLSLLTGCVQGATSTEITAMVAYVVDENTKTFGGEGILWRLYLLNSSGTAIFGFGTIVGGFGSPCTTAATWYAAGEDPGTLCPDGFPTLECQGAPTSTTGSFDLEWA